MALRLRAPEEAGVRGHFAPTDPEPRLELTRNPLLRRALRSRLFQFTLILPNQIIFWIVILTGLFGAALPTRNFATVITWYIWFCAVFLLMVGVGRGWCVMCPFGGLAEWVQRRTLFARKTKTSGLGRRLSAGLSRYGLLPSVAVFVLLTWAEEYFNIAGPGLPRYTSFLVLFVISFALFTFLWTERRTFCRYLCPLTALIGTVGATGMVSGFRTRDRARCLTCPTKDCMRGGANGYGCPWYEWPGSATANLFCGLCSECYKSCPYDNIGLYAQPPLTSVIKPLRRRLDVAIAVLVLFGLVVFQQVNALPLYTVVDDALNRALRFPGYPNPVDYFAIIAAVAGLVAAVFAGLKAAFGRKEASFASYLAPLAYGFIPLMAADYLARQLPRFFDHFLRIVPAISDPFALGWNLFGTAHSPLYDLRLLSTPGVVRAQLVAVALGTAGSVYATWRIARRDLAAAARRPKALALAAAAFAALAGIAVMVLYVAMGGAE